MLAAGLDTYAQERHKREPVKMGTMIKEKDPGAGRELDRRLFMPKGAKSAGVQFSYFDLSSTDSELLMLIRGLHAHGTYFSVAPFVSYCIKDNKAVGLKIRYSIAEAGISEADFNLLSDDLNLSIEDIKGSSDSFMSEVFYRSYVGLDGHGRFGLFNDIALQYSSTKTSFSLSETDMDAYTMANKIKLAVRPGLEVFMLNNVSTQFSIGIGGVSYTNTKYVKAGERIGTNNVSRARFMLDVMDISMGLTLHF